MSKIESTDLTSKIELKIHRRAPLSNFENYIFNVSESISEREAKLIAYGKMFELFYNPGTTTFEIFLNEERIFKGSIPDVIKSDFQTVSES